MGSEFAGELLVKAADDVRDMGQRVVNNGAERCYALEKLSHALFKAAEGLTYAGCDLGELVEVVGQGNRHAVHSLRGWPS